MILGEINFMLVEKYERCDMEYHTVMVFPSAFAEGRLFFSCPLPENLPGTPPRSLPGRIFSIRIRLGHLL